MATPVFPIAPSLPGLWGWPGIAWDVKKTPEFSTAVYTARSLRETLIGHVVYPRWHFELSWELLRDSYATPMYDGVGTVLPAAPHDELRQILGFFLARGGRREPFFFSDPTDRLVVNQTIAVTTTASQDFFQCPRSFAGFFVEPVGGVQAIGAFTINGAAQSGGYVSSIQLNKARTAIGGTVIDRDGWILLPSAPAAGATLVATFFYYFKVRFEDDEQDFRNFMADFWSASRVGFVTVKG